ncbi:MAG: ABC transporter permease [Chitinophagaceae bacterium]|nr:ABC transporter permease [Chitinophagaceae bacterium]
MDDVIIVDQKWDLEIKPTNSIFNLQLKDVWNYRDLLWLLVRRDFVSFYKQTILGPLWFFIQPLFTTIIFTLVFGQMGGFSTDSLPQPLFYMAGITAWNYFAECLTKTSTVFSVNAAIFGKVYFPRLIMPLSIVVSNLVRFGVQLLLFLMVMGFYWYQGARFNITWAIALFPIIVVLMALLGLGGGMIISSLTTKYRDLAFLFTFAVQLLMYATTVIYPLSSAPEKYKWLIELNPMTAIIETFRYGFLGQGSFTWYSFGYSSLVTCGLVVFGVIIFNKVEKNFIDTV